MFSNKDLTKQKHILTNKGDYCYLYAICFVCNCSYWLSAWTWVHL